MKIITRVYEWNYIWQIRYKLWNILEFFKSQNPSFLANDLIRDKWAKNEQLVNNINDGLMNFRNTIIREEIP